MPALVVHSSTSPHLRAVTQAVEAGLSHSSPSRVLGLEEARRAAPHRDGLLVLGAPSLPEVGGRELGDWLADAAVPRDTEVALFECGPRSVLAGSVTFGLRHQARRRGLWVVCRPQLFLEDEASRSLLPGEVERAERWARALAALASAPRASARAAA